jgi:signal transduction histidine kinase/ActR/RegA family two-component response regulator
MWRDNALRSLLPILAGFAFLLLFAIAQIFLSIEQRRVSFWAHQAIEIQGQLNEVQTAVADAETGQRGYLLTGRLSYLEPYETARRELGPKLDYLASETLGDPIQQKSLANLRALIDRKLKELQETIDLRSSGKADEALAIVNNDSGKELMAGARQAIADMQAQETSILDSRTTSSNLLEWADRVALVVGAILIVVFGAITLAGARKRVVAVEAANEKLREETAQRLEAEKQVRQLQKMEAIGQLTGGIAHDFNNMLAVIIGSIDMASRRLTGVENPAVSRSLKNASEGANRAALLTSRLLAFSRQQPLEPTVLDANKLVSAMSELLRRTLGETIEVETVLAGGLWKTFADASQLESALLNLAVNARDAMLQGGRLTIETGNADLDERYASAHVEVKAGQYIMISVTDTGVGMSPQVIERAFDPFYTTKSAGKGTGLGLSQVFGFVKQSAGHLKLYSEIGHGTTAKIYLPRTNRELTPNEESETPDGVPQGAIDQVILVVEDDTAVREMTVSALRDLGYTVVHAPSGRDALRYLDSHANVALLFTDVVMPEMNGRELAVEALKRRPGLKVLYTTGYTRNAIVHNGVVDPGTAFLAKPFTIKQLATKVDHLLKAPASAAE